MNELDDFDELENQGSLNTDISISNVYSTREGGFGFNALIKTYLTTLSVAELQEDVSFYETLSNDKEWPVSQIIQREVDSDRVNLISKKYLLVDGRPVKYFPPIIVALLPREIDGAFATGYDFSPDNTNGTKNIILNKSRYSAIPRFRKIVNDAENTSLVDGLYIFNTSQVFDQTLVCWDKSKFYAVVIDGQHRLEALIRSARQDRLYTNAKQDVVFLDVSKFVKSKTAFTPVEVLRTVFVDINTNAKSVGIVRRILMDDKDLASLCVQSLVESINSDGSTKAAGEFIPSVLIDWYGDALKHELPHISGLLTLHQIISDELVVKKLTQIDDHRDAKAIDAFIKLLNQKFFVDATIESEAEFSDITTLERSFELYLEQREITMEIFAEEYSEGLDSILFTYDYRVLEVAQRNFERFYLKPFINILMGCAPYASAIDIIKKQKGFQNDAVIYKALLMSRAKLAKNGNFAKAFTQTRNLLKDKLYGDFFLFFTVVGQKGIYRTFFEKLDAEFKTGSNAGTVVKVQTAFLKDLNDTLDFLKEHNIQLFGEKAVSVDVDGDLEEFGTVATSFWEGIMYENERIVYNSQGVKAFADIIKFVIDTYKITSKGGNTKPLLDTKFRFSPIRTKRLLNKNFGTRSDNVWDQVSESILNQKKSFVIGLFEQAIKKKKKAK